MIFPIWTILGLAILTCSAQPPPKGGPPKGTGTRPPNGTGSPPPKGTGGSPPPKGPGCGPPPSRAAGAPCSGVGQCRNGFCCGSPSFYCSSCCLDSDCPTSDICLIQANLQPGTNFRTCFPSRILATGSPCWRNEMCISGTCTGGSQTGWTVVNGSCA